MATASVLSGPERRRRWTSAEKHRIVEESLTAGTTVVEIARRHDIHPNLLHLWRRQARGSTLARVSSAGKASAEEARFASVAIAADARILAPPSVTIEIELASGTRVRITGTVDAAMVSAAVAAAVRAESHR